LHSPVKDRGNLQPELTHYVDADGGTNPHCKWIGGDHNHNGFRQHGVSHKKSHVACPKVINCSKLAGFSSLIEELSMHCPWQQHICTEKITQYFYILIPVSAVKVRQNTAKYRQYTGYSSHSSKHLPVQQTVPVLWCHIYGSYGLWLTPLM
jgi:hypothetical protein